MVADEERERAAAILMASEEGRELPDDFDPGWSEDVPARFSAQASGDRIIGSGAATQFVLILLLVVPILGALVLLARELLGW